MKSFDPLLKPLLVFTNHVKLRHFIHQNLSIPYLKNKLRRPYAFLIASFIMIRLRKIS